MCGQWVEPGGGLPTGAGLGRRLVQALCKEDGVAFQSSTAVRGREEHHTKSTKYTQRTQRYL